MIVIKYPGGQTRVRIDATVQKMTLPGFRKLCKLLARWGEDDDIKRLADALEEARAAEVDNSGAANGKRIRRLQTMQEYLQSALEKEGRL